MDGLVVQFTCASAFKKCREVVTVGRPDAHACMLHWKCYSEFDFFFANFLERIACPVLAAHARCVPPGEKKRPFCTLVETGDIMSIFSAP